MSESGEIRPGAGVPEPTAAAEQPFSDAPGRLKEARQLLDAKLITDAEYEAIKARILSSA